MKTARLTIRPKSQRWLRPVVKFLSCGLHRPGRQGHHPGLTRLGRLRHLRPAGRHGGQQLVDDIGAGLNGSFGQYPGTDSAGAEMFQGLATAAGFDGTSAFAPESYDAAALIMMAMHKAGSANSADWAPTVMDLANAPGEQIFPGELAKALELIALAPTSTMSARPRWN